MYGVSCWGGVFVQPKTWGLGQHENPPRGVSLHVRGFVSCTGFRAARTPPRGGGPCRPQTSHIYIYIYIYILDARWGAKAPQFARYLKLRSRPCP